MGFDGIASQMILFIAVIGASIVLIAGFQDHLSVTTSAIYTKQDFVSQQLKTDISIEIANYESNQITFYAKNTGQTQLKLESTSYYVNGEWIADNADRSITLVSDTNTVNPTIWDPQEVIVGVINKTLSSSQSHELTIVSQYQVSATKKLST